MKALNNLAFYSRARKKSIIKIILSLAILTEGAMSDQALGKVARMSDEQMVTDSKIIAVVDILAVTPCDLKAKLSGTHYTEKAQVQIKDVLKGAFPAKGLQVVPTAEIFGGAVHLCAPVKFEKGTALVFLEEQEQLLKSANWERGIRAITDGEIVWGYGASSNERQMSLDEALVDIRSKLCPKSLLPLLTATQFTDGVVGDATEPSKQWQAYQAGLLQGEASRPHLYMLLKNATYPGRIYAACLLYKLNREQGLKELEKLKSVTTTISYRSGCKVTNASVSEVATALVEKKRFYNFALH